MFTNMIHRWVHERYFGHAVHRARLEHGIIVYYCSCNTRIGSQIH